MSDDIHERRGSDMQIILLQKKLDDHIEEYKQHCEDEDKRWDHLIVAQETNTQAIKDLTIATQDIVTVWQAADGTMKTMSALGKFIKWLSGFAVIGIFIGWLVEHFK